MTGWDVATTILPLILVLGLLYAALIFVRKSGFTIGKKTNKNSDIEIISTKAIMPRKFISVVKVQDSYLVLGISENSINLLKEMEDFNEEIKDESNIKKQSFKDVFKENLGMK